MTCLLAVRLDHPWIGSGPGTGVAHVESVAYFRARYGYTDRRMRLWEGNAPIGARVYSTLVCGTGRGITHLFAEDT